MSQLTCSRDLAYGRNSRPISNVSLAYPQISPEMRPHVGWAAAGIVRLTQRGAGLDLAAGDIS